MILGKNINLRLFEKEEIILLNKSLNNLEERGEYEPLGIGANVAMEKAFDETGFWEKDSGDMAITDKEDKIIGTITFFKGMKGCAGYEIGYSIHEKKNRGKGYGSEALKIFTSYLFELKEINRLQVCVFEGNTASRRIAEKCGYTYEGTMRKAFFARGKYHNLECLSILREECKSLSEVLEEIKK